MGLFRRLFTGKDASPLESTPDDRVLSIDEGSQKYSDLAQQMRETKSQEEKFKFASQAIPFLPAWIGWFVRETGSFGVNSVGAIEFLTTYFTIHRDRAALKALKDDLLPHKIHLEEWLNNIDKAMLEIDEIDKIVCHLKESPGVMQSKIGKAIGVPQKFVGWYLGWAEKNELVRREKEGKSHRIYLVINPSSRPASN